MSSVRDLCVIFQTIAIASMHRWRSGLRSGSQVNHGTNHGAHVAPELELAAAAGLHRRLSQHPQRAARVSTAAESFTTQWVKLL